MKVKNIESSIGVPAGDTKKYETRMGKWLSKTLTFEKITHAHFTDKMVMAIVEFDKDNCIYVLVPEKIFKED